jgi:hypothetical protein
MHLAMPTTEPWVRHIGWYYIPVRYVRMSMLYISVFNDRLYLSQQSRGLSCLRLLHLE